MKILRLSEKCGSPCGQLVLSTLLDDNLPQGYLDGYIISLRDEHLVYSLPTPESGRPESYAKTFTFGQANAIVAQAMDSTAGVRRIVKITIESRNAGDFAELYRCVYRDWLNIPHEIVPLPKYRLQEPSFVRGVRNDLRQLRELIKNRWRRVRASVERTA